VLRIVALEADKNKTFHSQHAKDRDKSLYIRNSKIENRLQLLAFNVFMGAIKNK
jgi:hypothetical protein